MGGPACDAGVVTFALVLDEVDVAVLAALLGEVTNLYSAICMSMRRAFVRTSMRSEDFTAPLGAGATIRS